MSQFQQSPSPALQRAHTWWRDARVVWAKAIRREDMTPEEIARLASDTPSDPDSGLIILGRTHGAAALLYQKLRALELNPDEIYHLSPLLLAELEHNCGECPDKERCAADMAEDPSAPGWEIYCPNSGTLRTLT